MSERGFSIAALQYEEQKKYILFGLEGETYCIPILKAQEIIADYSLTHFPNLPELYHGVISLRGEAIPVINLRERFSLISKDRDERTRVIIIDLEDRAVGIQVDEVLKVVALPAETINAPPRLSGGQRTPYISGVTELETGKFTLLLDIEEILRSMDKIELSKMRDSIVKTLSSNPASAIAPLPPKLEAPSPTASAPQKEKRTRKKSVKKSKE